MADLKILKEFTKLFEDTKRSLEYYNNNLRNEVFDGCEYFCEVSMGMSGDYPIAIEEGATIVRIGSSIFGVSASGTKICGCGDVKGCNRQGFKECKRLLEKSVRII